MKNGSRPLDLGPFTRQLSDRIGGAQGLTLLTPDRILDRHRDIGVCEIGIHENRRSGIFMVKVPGRISAFHPREDACHVIVHSGDPGIRHRDIGTREIGVLEAVKVGTF